MTEPAELYARIAELERERDAALMRERCADRVAATYEQIVRLTRVLDAQSRGEVADARALCAQALADGLAECARLRHVLASELERHDEAVCTDCGARGALSGWGCLPLGWTPDVMWAVLGADPVRCPKCSPPQEPLPAMCETCFLLMSEHAADCEAALAEGPPAPAWKSRRR